MEVIDLFSLFKSNCLCLSGTLNGTRPFCSALLSPSSAGAEVGCCFMGAAAHSFTFTRSETDGSSSGGTAGRTGRSRSRASPYVLLWGPTNCLSFVSV